MAGYGRVWQDGKLGRAAFHDTGFETTMAEHGIHWEITEKKAKSMMKPVHMGPLLPQTLVISVPGHRMHLDFTPQFQGVAAKASCHSVTLSSHSQGAACQARDKRASRKETFGEQLSVWKNGAACSPTGSTVYAAQLTGWRFFDSQQGFT